MGRYLLLIYLAIKAEPYYIVQECPSAMAQDKLATADAIVTAADYQKITCKSQPLLPFKI